MIKIDKLIENSTFDLSLNFDLQNRLIFENFNKIGSWAAEQGARNEKRRIEGEGW